MKKENDAGEAVKGLAEMTYVFFKHCLDLGASTNEASEMTRAYISALLDASGNGDE